MLLSKGLLFHVLILKGKYVYTQKGSCHICYNHETARFSRFV